MARLAEGENEVRQLEPAVISILKSILGMHPNEPAVVTDQHVHSQRLTGLGHHQPQEVVGRLFPRGPVAEGTPRIDLQLSEPLSTRPRQPNPPVLGSWRVVDHLLAGVKR